jgi:PiT family inorganic phosphate transporter
MNLTLVAVVAIALFFDFTNGFHDTANSIATSVSTRALSPRVAVASAAVLNFAGAFVSVAVAATIAKGIVDQDAMTLEVVMAGLVGAITWNLVTWLIGLPSSSSHALIGGMIGSAIAASGWGVVHWGGIKDKVLIPSLIAPFLGVAFAFVLILGITWLVARRAPTKVNRGFRRAQLVSGAFVAFTHGTNDAQKTMGIIALALVASGHLDPNFERPPTWVIAASALAMAAGTYAGGWRIIKTLGQRIAKIDPAQGFAAQTACASILWGTAHFGFPVSTTHTISGSVLGAGAVRGFHAVRWGVAGNILVAWILTIPAAALVGAFMELVTRLPGGHVIVFVLAILIAAAAFSARRFERRRLAPPPEPTAVVAPATAAGRGGGVHARRTWQFRTWLRAWHVPLRHRVRTPPTTVALCGLRVPFRVRSSHVQFKRGYVPGTSGAPAASERRSPYVRRLRACVADGPRRPSRRC